MPKLNGYFVIDVESVGLYGEAFAVAFVVVDLTGKVVEQDCYHCPIPVEDEETHDNVLWAMRNVRIPDTALPFALAETMRWKFWRKWLGYKERGYQLFAECLFPVEAAFIGKCVMQEHNEPYRINHSPYPFHDIASIRLAKGFDPAATEEREPNELPAHNPLCDARQSARLLMEALGKPLRYDISGPERVKLLEQEPPRDDDRFHAGDKVVILDGPLKGLEYEVVTKTHEHKGEMLWEVKSASHGHWEFKQSWLDDAPKLKQNSDSGK